MLNPMSTPRRDTVSDLCIPDLSFLLGRLSVKQALIRFAFLWSQMNHCVT
jgi:hypothetical protein